MLRDGIKGNLRFGKHIFCRAEAKLFYILLKAYAKILHEHTLGLLKAEVDDRRKVGKRYLLVEITSYVFLHQCSREVIGIL